MVTRTGDETSSKQLNRDFKLETSKVFNLVFEATISERLPSNLVLWVNVCLVAQLLGVGCKLLEVCESSEADGFGCCSAPVLHLSLIHISEPTRRTPISYAVFCLKKKK